MCFGKFSCKFRHRWCCCCRQSIDGNSSGGGKPEKYLGYSGAERQERGSRRRRPSIVVQRMKALTQLDSILPVQSWWLRSDKSQRVCCPVLLDSNNFPFRILQWLSFLENSLQRWWHLSVSGFECVGALMLTWSDNALMLTGHLWAEREVPLFDINSQEQVWLVNSFRYNNTWLHTYA